MTVSITLLHKAKENPADWFDNYHLLKEYWFGAKLDDRLWALRTSENRIFVEIAIHETNCNLSTLRGWEDSYTKPQYSHSKFDLNVFARMVETVFIQVCAVDLYLELNETKSTGE